MTNTIEALPLGASVGVIGTGTMGEGIAQVLLQSGYQVLLFDQSSSSAIRAEASIEARLARLVEKGILSSQEKNRALASLQVVSTLEAFHKTELVIEAIVENLEVKQTLFKRLEEIVNNETILASNTSSISITAIGSALAHPERLAGWHFFNPAPLMKLVEVVSGLATDPAIAETLYKTAEACGKTPVHTASTPGFIVNRVARPFYAEALRVMQESKAHVADIDQLFRESGNFKMGPFELMDLIGNDVNYSVTESVWQAFYYDARFTPSLIQKSYVDAGFYGRKTGRGFYRYEKESGGALRKVIADQREATKKSVSQSALPVIRLNQLSPFYTAWIERFNRAGVEPHLIETISDESAPFMTIGEAECFITKGITATEMAYTRQTQSVVMLDLARDYREAKSIGVSRSENCLEANFEAVLAVLTALEFNVVELDDLPGMLVMRTVAMLVNEASDTVHQGVSTIAEVDTAMTLGVNYPQGPFDWADQIGTGYLCDLLNNLHQRYGDPRYRLSPLLQHYLYSGRPFYDET